MCCFVCIHLVPVVADLLGNHVILRSQELVVCSSDLDVSQQPCALPVCGKQSVCILVTDQSHPIFQVPAIHQRAGPEDCYRLQLPQRTEARIHLEVGMAAQETGSVPWPCLRVGLTLGYRFVVQIASYFPIKLRKTADLDSSSR